MERVALLQTQSSKLLPATSYLANPNEAYSLSIETLFIAGSVGAFIWDILFNLAADFELLKRHHANMVSIIYVASRLSTLIFALMEAIVFTVPINNCRHYQIATLLFYNLFIASSMLLTYFRVCAIWSKCPIITSVFGLLWLATISGSLTSAVGVVSTHGIGSPYCTEMVSHAFVAAAVLTPLVNNLAVFVAITYGLCKTCTNNQEKMTIKKGYRIFILGESLQKFSKALLQTCQLCYLAAALSGVAAVVTFYLLIPNSSYRFGMFVPYAVVINIMFSWVFRKTKLGICAGTNNATSGRGAVPCSSASTRIMESCTGDLSRITSTVDSCGTGTNDRSSPVEIKVESVVEYKTDYLDPERQEEKGVIGVLGLPVIRTDS
ncbi:hypothetical protein CVT26_005050 [Gymnopilus dilepis]|uniref:G-protein coupled receptors family 1 profile domain-containing protein n=1 Tax=Gymnopilus dilepis TaxID=231916 RepID=A0A409W8J3_9AGAR|nr:hypothetical protein CVT26_005050 [Gymnopilus dilepis]